MLDNRFWSKVDITNSCWNWTAYTSKLGYGHFGIGNKLFLPHRLSYEFFKGKIPKGFDIDHLCRNPSCINPNHLEAVTHQVNMSRGYYPRRDQTHCKSGHEFTPANTYLRPNNRGRDCQICREIRRQKYLDSKKQKEILI